jgi:CheY-like chemotaxis protein
LKTESASEAMAKILLVEDNEMNRDMLLFAVSAPETK